MITKEQFAKAQDHSVLGTYVSKEDVGLFCEETIKYGFASVYVNPCDVAYAKSIVGERAKIGTVIGFPQGANSTATKIFEGLDAIENGADELDIVINVSRLKDGDTDYVKNELAEFNKSVKQKKPDVIVKVIIECFYLTHRDKITAAEIVASSGADYIKQSTGTTPNNSFTLGDTKLLKAIVGDRVKIKSSGWIITIEDAIGSMEFGASRIGNSLAVKWLEEFDENRWYE
ncbi:MAG: deoxyribose-phosphate aldolase [Oscillospiraceae bacterium]|nr:deoxyribose-phosphate aldolase [Oscillospiraceae bacterium]